MGEVRQGLSDSADAFVVLIDGTCGSVVVVVDCCSHLELLFVGNR